MKKTKLDIFILLYSVASLIIFISISFFRWRSTDDFIIPVILEEKSVINFAIENYLNWDAKFLSPFFLLWFTCVKYFNYKILIPLASFSFIGISYCIVYIVNNKCDLKLNIYSKIIFTSLLNLFLFITIYPYLSDILYWMIGSVYIHSVLLCLIWLVWYNNSKEFSKIFYLFTFFISTLPQNITIGVAAIIVIDYILNLPNKKALYLLIIMFIGILLSTFSPGSFRQLQLMQGENYNRINNSNNLTDYLFHFFKIYKDAISINYIFILLFSLLFAFLIKGFVNNPIKEIKFNLIFYREKLKTINYKNFLSKYKFFIGAFFCLTIYWPTLLFGFRYYIGFHIFIFIGFILFFNKFESTIRNVRFGINISIIVVLSFSFYCYGLTLRESIMVNKFMFYREQLLFENKGISKLDIPSIDFSTFTRSVRSVDLSENPNFITNKYYSKYYKIDSVVSTYTKTKADIEGLNFK